MYLCVRVRFGAITGAAQVGAFVNVPKRAKTAAYAAAAARATAGARHRCASSLRPQVRRLPRGPVPLRRGLLLAHEPAREPAAYHGGTPAAATRRARSVRDAAAQAARAELTAAWSAGRVPGWTEECAAAASVARAAAAAAAVGGSGAVGGVDLSKCARRAARVWMCVRAPVLTRACAAGTRRWRRWRRLGWRCGACLPPQPPGLLHTPVVQALKVALMARGVKCGGGLRERAERLLAIKGVAFADMPAKLRAPGCAAARAPRRSHWAGSN